jgi:hypothetical protein
VPALVIGGIAVALEGRVDPAISAGALALALVPAPLAAGGIVSRMRGRADLAGALGLGTVIVSLLSVGSRGALAAGGLFAATEAYAIAAMLASALPPVRDALLGPLRLVGWAAFAAVLVLALPEVPPIDGWTVLVAAALFVSGILAAAAVAIATRRDVVAAVAGAGLRDPALAIALAAVALPPGSTGVPLVYAVFCLGLAALALLRR